MAERAPSDGRQLLLEGLGLTALAREPWGGLSPRGLTRVALGGILKAQAEKSVSGLVIPGQLEFWPSEEKAPWKYQGAPLLVGLPRGG